MELENVGAIVSGGASGLGEATIRTLHAIPKGPFVHRIELPDTVDWVLTAPARLIVEDGVVRSAKAPVNPRNCR